MALSKSSKCDLTELLDSVQGMQDSKLVSIVDEALERLVKDSLAWRVRLPPKLVGVHPKNRGGWGVSGGNVHKLGSKVVEIGWSPSATEHAVCVEDFDNTCAAFTEKLVKESDGLLAANEADVQFGSLSCSHTNQFLVCANAGVKTEFENIAVNGYMSKAKLGQDPKLMDALTGGLTWLVISARAVVAYPQLPDLIQAARNATGAVHAKEDSLQLLQKVQSMAAASLKIEKAVDWEDIFRTVVRMAHCTKDELTPIVAFVQKYGGGGTMTFVNDLGKFFKTFVKPGRAILGTTWQALADVKVGVTDLCPLMMYAVLKAQGMSVKVDGHICKDFSAGDILSLGTSKRKDMLAGERVLAECRSVARNADAPDDVCCKAFGKLDVIVARIVLGKCKDGTNLEITAQEFVQTIAGGTRMGTQAAASGSAAVKNVVRYDEESATIAVGALQVSTQGFSVGDTVVKASKTDKEVIYTISNVQDDGTVDLIGMQDPAMKLAVGRDDFLRHYRRKNNVSFENFDGWADYIPARQFVYTDAVSRAYVLIAMAHTATNVDAPDLKVVISPVKGVFSKAGYSVNKLILIPESTKVILGEGQVDGSLMTGTIDGKGFCLAPTSCTKSFAVPAWVVRGATEEQLANMHVVLRKVQVAVNDTYVDVRIPVLANHRKINAGDELVMHKPAVEKKVVATKRPLSMPATGNAKAKAKVSPKA